MNHDWRAILLVIWLLILWTAESIVPLKKNSRRHLPINAVLTITTIVINALLVVTISKVVSIGQSNELGVFNVIELPFFIQVIIGVLLLDLAAAYLSHRAMHRFDSLWSFHRIHHLDEMVDVTTGLRQHPFETLLRFVFLLIGVILLGAPLSVVVIYQTLSALNALLEHANIHISGKLNRVLSAVFVTPDLHKVHHSTAPEHVDANFGNIFSFWDRLFGTQVVVKDPSKLSYGLLSEDLNTRPSLINLLVMPFNRKKADSE
jgi:sterol desaturase/sphingolipid hydroxylase (fatty acid hydroxylase superfamily)